MRRYVNVLPFVLCASLFAAVVASPLEQSLDGSPQPQDVETTLLLIGDAGTEGAVGDPVLAALTQEINKHPDRTLALFLGDNIYKNGMPPEGDPNRADAERRFKAQIDAARLSAQLVFIVGNHDWTRGDPAGDWNAVKRQGAFLASQGSGAMRPTAGCPGPEILDVGTHLRLLFLDTEWWLHGQPTPDAGLGCTTSTADEVTHAMSEAIDTAGSRHVVVVGHHPPVSAGPHGGHFRFLDHVFPLRNLKRWMWLPLPGLGSAYPLARKSGVFVQDQSHETYQKMLVALKGAIEPQGALLFAAGHEHQLGVFTGVSIGTRYVAVSGSGNANHQDGTTGSVKEALFVDRSPGFMRVEFLTDGRVKLSVLALTDTGDVKVAHVMWLT